MTVREAIGLSEEQRLTIPDYRGASGTKVMIVIDSSKVAEHAMEYYWALKKYEDTGATPEEVVAALEAQEPRAYDPQLLTLSMIKKLASRRNRKVILQRHGHMAIYMDSEDICPKGWLADKAIKEHGIEWRMWGVKHPPTAEQMAATPWDGKKEG
jgi:hypothetical protein